MTATNSTDEHAPLMVRRDVMRAHVPAGVRTEPIGVRRLEQQHGVAE